MYIKNLQLQNFRNYEYLSLTFSSKINIFLGQNAQGKTNLLESIYALALTKSHRTNKYKEMITWEAEKAVISGNIANRLEQLPLVLEFTKLGKIAKINHLVQAKLSQYIGQFNVVLFAPEDLDLVKGEPKRRRQFIDTELAQMNAKYLAFSSEYRQIFKTRNAYLKQLQSKQATDMLYLDVLTDQLIEKAEVVIELRQYFIQKLGAIANKIHSDITNNTETLSLIYQTSIDFDSGQSIRDQLNAQILSKRPLELIKGTSQIGPHKDDLTFLINGKDALSFGSQGQQRTIVLVMKLAEIEMIKDETGEYPVLLLDDVLSELDTYRQTQLLLAIQDRIQTFLTTPSLNDVAKELIKAPRIFNVQAGKITE